AGVVRGLGRASHRRSSVTPPFSGLFLSVSAKMAQNGTAEKGGSRWKRFSSVSNTTGALWTAKLLNSKHFHRGWTRKPHENEPNAQIGRVRTFGPRSVSLPSLHHTSTAR